MQQMVRAEEALALVYAVVNSVKVNVADRHTRARTWNR